MFGFGLKGKNSLLGVAPAFLFSKLWDGCQTYVSKMPMWLRRCTGRREGLLTQISEQKKCTFCFAVYFILGRIIENHC